jgi:hypothetical protein
MSLPLHLKRVVLSGMRPWPCVARTKVNEINQKVLTDVERIHAFATQIGLSARTEFALTAF